MAQHAPSGPPQGSRTYQPRLASPIAARVAHIAPYPATRPPSTCVEGTTWEESTPVCAATPSDATHLQRTESGTTPLSFSPERDHSYTAAPTVSQRCARGAHPRLATLVTSLRTSVPC